MDGKRRDSEAVTPQGSKPMPFVHVFERLMDDLSRCRERGFSDVERLAIYDELIRLHQDFLYTAETYGVMIIKELCTEAAGKLIQPRDMGGIAGGDKYVCNGILFKVVNGCKGPYNGSDEAAAKAAGNDLRCVQHYLNTHTKGLNVAMQALIDFRGFRLLAQAVLPLASGSLVMGTNDGGRTIQGRRAGGAAAQGQGQEQDQDQDQDRDQGGAQGHGEGGEGSDRSAQSAEVANIMRAAAQKLNLRGHSVVGSADNQAVTVYSGADVEGHIGTDGKITLPPPPPP